MMKTKVIDMTQGISEEGLQEAGEIIRKGGLVAFPTETVYGLGANALDSQASAKIYVAKGRPSDNPLIVHIADISSLYEIARSVPETALRLADAFWPGPLTMIFPKKDGVPYETTGGLDTVAVRFPSDRIALGLIRAGGGFIAAPSANSSGRPSPTRASHVIEDMDGKIEMIIDGGEVGIGVESTIVDLTGEVPMILRPGFVNERMLKEVLGQIDTDPTILNANCKERPKAPGMRYRHYAPKADMVIVEGEQERVIEYINRELAKAAELGRKAAVIAGEETKNRYPADMVESLGSRNREIEISRHLFSALREFDSRKVEVIFSEAFDTPDLGQAIMNRLIKAAGHQIIRV